jgi:CspA family cold shock protein
MSDRMMVVRPDNVYFKEAMMATGTVKWFNPTKGYGFIQPQDGSRDVFVHISAVERAGLSSLNEGQTIDYEIVSNRGKQSAENIKSVDRDGSLRHLDRPKRQQHDRKTFAGIRSRQQCRSSSQGPQEEDATRGRFS